MSFRAKYVAALVLWIVAFPVIASMATDGWWTCMATFFSGLYGFWLGCVGTIAISRCCHCGKDAWRSVES